jgi:hypothetical protein
MSRWAGLRTPSSRPSSRCEQAGIGGRRPSSTALSVYIFYVSLPLAPASVDELNRIATELGVGSLATETKGDG